MQAQLHAPEPRYAEARPHPMLVSRRGTGLRRLGASMESLALIHPGFRLDVSRNCNVVSDDRLLARAFERKGHLDRSQVMLVLEGRAVVRHGDDASYLGPGSMLLLPRRRGALVRQEGPSFLSVTIEWDAGTLGGRLGEPALQRALHAASLARAREVTDAIRSGLHAGDAPARFSEMVRVLREAGVPFDAPGPALFAGDIEPHLGVLSRALDESLSDLDRQPMVVDLEDAIGVSPRHVQRLVTRFHARYGFDAGGWRDALTRCRLRVGVALMTAPGAGTELVAGAVGYASSAALCHAFAESHLPAPSSIPGVVRDLQ